MITEQQWINYFSGAMSDRERAGFEASVAQDAEALSFLIEHEQIDTAIQALKGPAKTREDVLNSVLAVVSGISHEQAKVAVLHDIEALAVDQPKAMSATGAASASFWDWVRHYQRVLAWGALTVICLALGVWHLVGPKTETTLAKTREPRIPSPENPVPTTPRNPALWPFAASSPWNTAIGSEAIFAGVAPGGFDLSSGGMVVNSAHFHPVLMAQPDAPLARVYLRDETLPLASLHIPIAELQQLRAARNVHVISGDLVYQLAGPRSRGGADLEVMFLTKGSLRGSGMPPEMTSATASGLTTLGGNIRGNELTNGIFHVLGAVVPVEAISFRANGRAHVWPAAWTPDNTNWTERFSRSGNVQYGTLLAIPPSVDISQLGVGSSGPAYVIAKALQDYGVYVKDSFEGRLFWLWQGTQKPQLILCAELGEAETLSPDDQAKLSRAVSQLRVVVNNGPARIGGGGKPRRSPAPDFVPPQP